MEDSKNLGEPAGEQQVSEEALELEPLLVPTSIFYRDQNHITKRHRETHSLDENTPFLSSDNQHQHQHHQEPPPHIIPEDDLASTAFAHRRALSSDSAFALLRQRHVSLEQLAPHPACPSRRSCDRIATINLVATVCGGGVLSLPLAVARAGILPVTLLMVGGAAVTEFSLYLLIVCARRTGGRTYGDVAAAAFGGAARVVTTASLATMLMGTMTAYQVLVKGVWSGVVFALAPDGLQHILSGQWMHPKEEEDDEDVKEQKAANVLLGLILLLAFPLLLQKDLHALRHTCYVGFSSCVLLAVAVVYRGTQQQLRDNGNPKILWYSTDPADWLFAFPIVVLCFFCSYNALSVHASLIDPTRKRIRTVLDRSMLICLVLFYSVGVGGYLYAGQETADNILLNFPVGDPAILAGRSGFCLTLMFGLPLVLLPCRDALISIPEQIASGLRDATIVKNFALISERRRGGAHLLINGVDFDALEPQAIITDHSEKRHGAALLLNYGTHDDSTTEQTLTTCSSEDEIDRVPMAPTGDKSPSMINAECAAQWIHVGSTAMILVVTYAVAILVSLADIWSICGSSLAIWIAFIVPCGCYLKIREHKGRTLQSMSATALLIFSCVAAVICTRQAVLNVLD